jgi:hypothetical protein
VYVCVCVRVCEMKKADVQAGVTLLLMAPTTRCDVWCLSVR